MEEFRSTLQEFEEMTTKAKNTQQNKYVMINLERTKAEIMKKQQQHETDKEISLDHDQLDKEKQKELSNFAKRIEKDQAAQLKKALSDQHAIFERMIAQDRAIANEALRKTREKYDDIINKQQETIDSLNEAARAQVQGLAIQCSKFKGVIDNLIPSIEQQEVRHNMNVEVQDDMISMRRGYFEEAVDNYCAPYVAMRFKVFKLEELYSDLQKYGLRAHLGAFAIEGRYIKFYKFMAALKCHGYIFDAEVYYLNPAPWSRPPTDLIKIVGQDDVSQMARAHAEQGTKICLQYLVSRYENQNPDDVMTSESDEEADETSNMIVEPYSTEGIRQSGVGGQRPDAEDNP